MKGNLKDKADPEGTEWAGGDLLSQPFIFIQYFPDTLSFYYFRKFTILTVLAVTYFQGKEQSQGMLCHYCHLLTQ